MEGPDRPLNCCLYIEQQEAVMYEAKKSSLNEVNYLSWWNVQGWEQKVLNIRSLWTSTKDTDEKIKGKHQLSLGLKERKSYTVLPLARRYVLCACACMCQECLCEYSYMCAVKITSFHALFSYLTDLHRTQNLPS